MNKTPHNTAGIPGTLYAEVVAPGNAGVKLQIRNVYSPKRVSLAVVVIGDQHSVILHASTPQRAKAKLVALHAMAVAR